MGYCAWAGLNEADQIYHDTEKQGPRGRHFGTLCREPVP